MIPEAEFRAARLSDIAEVRRRNLFERDLRREPLGQEEQQLLQSWYRCCHKCGAIAPIYMVKDDLWSGAGLEFHGVVRCLACFEIDLGRPLTIEDFKPDVRCNSIVKFAYEMGRRDR